MINALTINQNVATAIAAYLHETVHDMNRTEKEAKVLLVSEHQVNAGRWERYEDGQYAALNDISTYDLMCLLVSDDATATVRITGKTAPTVEYKTVKFNELTQPHSRTTIDPEKLKALGTDGWKLAHLAGESIFMREQKPE